LLAEKVLEDPSLATDPRYIDNGVRVQNRVELTKIITDKLKQRDREYWLKKMTGLGWVYILFCLGGN
jgi:succinate--hydroxymethylglutarate CoA-transferase